MDNFITVAGNALMRKGLVGGTRGTARVAVGERPVSVAGNPDTNRIYVATADDDAVSVVDGATNTIIATISVALTP